MPNERLDKEGGKNLFIGDKKKPINYLDIPTGDYFNGDFSMLGMFELKSNKNLTLIEFSGSNMKLDSVSLSIQNNQLVLCIYDQKIPRCMKSKSLKLNERYHLAIVLQDIESTIFLNGTKNTETFLQMPRKCERSNNKIANNNEDVSLDYIKLYEGALTSSEIFNFFLSESEAKSTSKITSYFTTDIPNNTTPLG